MSEYKGFPEEDWKGIFKDINSQLNTDRGFYFFLMGAKAAHETNSWQSPEHYKEWLFTEYSKYSAPKPRYIKQMNTMKGRIEKLENTVSDIEMD